MEESAQTNSSTELQTYNSTSNENQMNNRKDEEASTELQTYNSTSHENQMNNRKDEEVATTEDLLQKDEELLLRQAIRSSSELKNLAHTYTNSLAKAIKEVKLAKQTLEQIKQIIREIYTTCFPNRKKFLGVLNIVRDVFYEDFLGWALLPNGKYNPKYWQVYHLTGERRGPTKFSPDYEVPGRMIDNLIQVVQKTLNEAQKNATYKVSDKNSEVCMFRPIGPQSFHLLLVALAMIILKRPIGPQSFHLLILLVPFFLAVYYVFITIV
jgi:hypothetical protein